MAQRFIATPDAKQARRAAVLSGSLYLVWPLVLFFPMWVAPVLLPHMVDPSQSYAILTQTLLPPGLIGLVLAGLFAHSMAMTSSDANAISAVIVRDIVPALRGARPHLADKTQLLLGRITTFSFLLLSMCLALGASHFGGVIGLLILWYGALLGPIATPMVLGMLQVFRRSGPAAAIISWIAGAAAFAITKSWPPQDWLGSYGYLASAITVSAPVITSLIVYIAGGFIAPSHSQAAQQLLRKLAVDDVDSN